MKLPTWDNKRKERTVLRSSESRAARPAAVRPCGLKNGKVDRLSCVVCVKGGESIPPVV